MDLSDDDGCFGSHSTAIDDLFGPKLPGDVEQGALRPPPAAAPPARPVVAPVALTTPFATQPPNGRRTLDLYVEPPASRVVAAALRAGAGRLERADRPWRKRPRDEPELEALGAPAASLAALRGDRAAAHAYAAAADAPSAPSAESPRGTTATDDAGALGHVREVGALRCRNGVATERGEPLRLMADATRLLEADDARGLWAAYARDGYVLLRGIVEADAARRGRAAAVEPLREEGDGVHSPPAAAVPPSAPAAHPAAAKRGGAPSTMVPPPTAPVAPAAPPPAAPPPPAPVDSQRSGRARTKPQRLTDLVDAGRSYVPAPDDAGSLAPPVAQIPSPPPRAPTRCVGAVVEAAAGYTVTASTGDAIRGTAKRQDGAQTDRSKARWRRALATPAFRQCCAAPALERALRLLAEGRRLAAGGPQRAVLLDPQFTWVRLKAPGERTVEHADAYHFERETNLWTGAVDDDASVPTSVVDDDVACEVCSETDEADTMLLCDECDSGYHAKCLGLAALPRGEWFCERCAVRPHLGTAWLPLQDIKVGDGGLVVLAGSHALDFAQGASRGAPLPRAFFRRPRGGAWHTAAYAPGDCVLFASRTIHATSRNRTAGFRASLDTRFLLEPAGQRRKWSAYVETSLARGLVRAVDD